MKQYYIDELEKGSIYITGDYRMLEFVERQGNELALFHEIDIIGNVIDENILLTKNELIFLK